MKKKDSFNRQFKRGYSPDEPISPGGPILREASAPSMRKRQSVAIDSQMEARPGMSGKQNFKDKQSNTGKLSKQKKRGK